MSACTLSAGRRVRVRVPPKEVRRPNWPAGQPDREGVIVQERHRLPAWVCPFWLDLEADIVSVRMALPADLSGFVCIFPADWREVIG